MADTLEELRKHVEDVIRRLSDAEAPAEPDQVRASDATLGELERQINLLGSKVERASNMLAQVTDLLESQTERIETLEQQVDDPKEGWSDPVRAAAPIATAAPRVEAPVPRAAAGAPVAATPVAPQPRDTRDDQLVEAVNNLLESVRVEVAALGTELRERVRGLEAHVAEIFGRFGELRDLAWQHRGELRDLEERLLIFADSHMQADAREGSAEPPAAELIPPARAIDVSHKPASGQISGTDGGLTGERPPQPVRPPSVPDAAAIAQFEDVADAPMDARTVRRLEELVEREVRLQQEFAPGAVGPAPGHRGRISVMVVDDLPDARKILSIYLSRTGYHVVTASSAEDCLAKLRHHEVDALVVDASMPGGGGGQVCRVVREDPAFAHKRDLPIIVYTAYPDQYPPELVRQWNATEYVVKGGDMLPLITALVRHTGGGLDVRP